MKSKFLIGLLLAAVSLLGQQVKDSFGGGGGGSSTLAGLTDVAENSRTQGDIRRSAIATW